MSRSSPPTRAWQRMLSGRRLDLLDPSPLDVEIGALPVSRGGTDRPLVIMPLAWPNTALSSPTSSQR